jgi:hypothetical protein
MAKIGFSELYKHDEVSTTRPLPPWCRSTDGSNFNEIMDLDWEELVIRFDEHKNDYVFKTACCKGAHVC